MTDDKSERIAQLNDNLRTTFNPKAGRILLTHGFHSLDDGDKQQILNLVKTFNNFSEDNDPYGEHDFGKVEYNGVSTFFKFDYYDKSLERGSPDPSDREVTERVMTVMLSSEY